MSAITQPTWKLGATAAFVLVIILAIVFASMRAVGTLGPVNLRFLLPLGFVLMAAAPWVLATRDGRREIGFKKAQRASIYLQSVVFGAAAALVCFVLGLALFGTSADNWFVSVARSFSQSANIELPTLQMYMMFTIPAMIFSPIGEEIYFRGLLQRALEERFSVRISTWIECFAFGLIHLCHHGLVLGALGLVLLPRSAPIWVVLMTLVAYLFAWLRKRSGSIYPAIAAHSAFNFTMGTCIFSALWPV